MSLMNRAARRGAHSAFADRVARNAAQRNRSSWRVVLFRNRAILDAMRTSLQISAFPVVDEQHIVGIIDANLFAEKFWRRAKARINPRPINRCRVFEALGFHMNKSGAHRPGAVSVSFSVAPGHGDRQNALSVWPLLRRAGAQSGAGVFSPWCWD
jgi:hypothetical protein